MECADAGSLVLTVFGRAVVMMISRVRRAVDGADVSGTRDLFHFTCPVDTLTGSAPLELHIDIAE